MEFKVKFSESISEQQALKWKFFPKAGSRTIEADRWCGKLPNIIIENEASLDIRKRFLAGSNQRFPDGFYILDDVITFDNWGIVTDSEKKFSPNFLPGFGWNDDHVQHLCEKGFFAKTDDHDVYKVTYGIEKSSDLSGLSCLLTFPGALTFGHWILDIVPRVLALPYALRREVDHFLLPSPFAPWMNMFIQALGIERHQITFLDKRTLYKCEKLVVPLVPTQAPFGLPSKLAVKSATELLSGITNSWSLLANSEEYDICVMTHTPLTSSPGRLLSNLEILGSFLKSKGYSFIEVNPMVDGFVRTVNALSGSQICVGQDSSALHNLAFSHNNLIVIETEKRRNLLHAAIQTATDQKICHIDAILEDGCWVLGDNQLDEIARAVTSVFA